MTELLSCCETLITRDVESMVNKKVENTLWALPYILALFLQILHRASLYFFSARMMRKIKDRRVANFEVVNAKCNGSEIQISIVPHCASRLDGTARRERARRASHPVPCINKRSRPFIAATVQAQKVDSRESRGSLRRRTKRYWSLLSQLQSNRIAIEATTAVI